MAEMDMYRIVETDNFDGDYPDESFVNLPPMNFNDAHRVANAINDALCPRSQCQRYWKVVKVGYELRPGFQP